MRASSSRPGSAFVLVGVLAAGLFAAGLPAGPAFAQSGSTGGSIGKGEKSLSGDEEAGRSAAPVRRRAAEPERGRAPRPAAPSFDGAWVVRSFGETCSGGATQAVVVSSGRIIGQDVSGTVSSSGAVSTVGGAGGLRVVSSGRLTARGGQGRFQQSDGCVGRWIASKQ